MVKWGQMKHLASITALILSACAHASPGIAVPPPSDFVDTEAATNVVFDAGDVHVRRLDLALELNAAASNSVIVAWGFDANTNGVLERVEADVFVGWEGGVWFWRDRRAHIGQQVARGDGVRRLDVRLHLDAQRRAKSLAASDADGSVFAANVPATMFDSAWNLIRVSTRGSVPPSGVVVSRTAVLGYGITVR